MSNKRGFVSIKKRAKKREIVRERERGEKKHCPHHSICVLSFLFFFVFFFYHLPSCRRVAHLQFPRSFVGFFDQPGVTVCVVFFSSVQLFHPFRRRVCECVCLSCVVTERVLDWKAGGLKQGRLNAKQPGETLKSFPRNRRRHHVHQ